MHGTRGTTGSEGCLLLYSGVGKSLIFPIPLFLLPKFDAGKPGGESVSALLHSRTLTEFSGQSGRRVRECVSVYRRAPRVFRECPAIQQCAPGVFRINQRAGMQLKHFGSKAWLAPHMDRLLGDVAASLSLLRFWKAGPVFLRSLLRLVGRDVDRRFYFGHLSGVKKQSKRAMPIVTQKGLKSVREAVPGAGPPARTSCCATAS